MLEDLDVSPTHRVKLWRKKYQMVQHLPQSLWKEGGNPINRISTHERELLIHHIYCTSFCLYPKETPLIRWRPLFNKNMVYIILIAKEKTISNVSWSIQSTDISYFSFLLMVGATSIMTNSVRKKNKVKWLKTCLNLNLTLPIKAHTCWGN